jgi:hypothetical protein
MPLEKLCLANQFIQRHIAHVLYSGPRIESLQGGSDCFWDPETG